jgi:hypothetical protein
MLDTRRFVESRLEDLSALWDGEPRIAREEIAKHVGKITLKPMLRMYMGIGVPQLLLHVCRNALRARTYSRQSDRGGLRRHTVVGIAARRST